MLINKTLTSFAASAVVFASALTMQAESKISATATLSYESEYIFRGEQLAGSSFQPSIDLATPALGGQLYGGIWFSTDIQSSQNNNEINYYAGFTQQITNAFTIDLGVTFYDYPHGNGTDDEAEIYFGLIGDFATSPGLYVYYNADLKQFILEGSLSHSFDLSDVVENTSLEVGVYGAYLSRENDSAAGSDSWFYYGATADIVYQVNDNATVSVGGRVAGNDKDNGSKDEHAWFGVSSSIGF